jgi:hypothetical protein
MPRKILIDGSVTGHFALAGEVPVKKGVFLPLLREEKC